MLRHTPRHYAETLFALVRVTPAPKLDLLIHRFVKLLTRERASVLLPRIVENYLDLSAAHDGKTRVSVESAKPLTAAELRVIAGVINHPPEKIVWDERTAPALLAGARIRHGDTTIRCSLTDRLERLSESL